jgi:hypothetical protein
MSVFNISQMRFLNIPFFGSSVRKAANRLSKIFWFRVLMSLGSNIRSMAVKDLLEDPLGLLEAGEMVSIEIRVRIEVMIGSG